MGFEIKIMCNSFLDKDGVGYLMLSQKDYNELLKRKYNKSLENISSKDIGSDIIKIVDDNFWDLI